MVLSPKVFAYVLCAVVSASSALASPGSSTTKHATHGEVIDLSPDLKLESFHPVSKFETFGEGIDHPLSKRADASFEDIAMAFIKSHLGIDSSNVAYKSGYAGEVARHAYFKQVHDGIPFVNAVANVALNTASKVVTFGSSFVEPTRIASSKPSVSLQDAISTAERTVNGRYNNHPATLEYLVQEDGSVALTHVIQIQNEDIGIWVEALVDAHSNKLISVIDFVNKASYYALPLRKQYPTQGYETITNPQDMVASPSGWHSVGTASSTDTSGNNVISYKGAASVTTTSESSAGLNFNYPQNPHTEPTTTANVNAARVNTFFVVNSIHDISYRYGFTEAAFNFQDDNFGKGQLGNDRVTISIQDPARMNNADFTTPPDGQSGHMRMYLFNYTLPYRDGALENDIVVHEYTHGITNRMTGGGTGRCIQTSEAKGLGEGWSDALAEWVSYTTSAVPDYALGKYVTNKTSGIRTHPYSTSPVTNPLRYSSIVGMVNVHNIGEVWANMLHNVYAALVASHGFSGIAKTNPTSTAGNAVFLHLFLDALALQPCNPTFVHARSAWIQADVNRYGGVNKCTLWREFASRGLGLHAGNYDDDSTVPAGC